MVYALTGLFICSWLLTWSVRRYALAKNIMDHPNHRSSHLIPTPRGGGVAFVVTFLFAIPFVAHLGLVTLNESLALIVGGSFIAILGFYDDRCSLSARWRLCGHFAASILALYWMNGMPSISLLGIIVPSNLFVDAIAVIYLVWLLNLYNFMDGIDGLASIEVITVCLGMAFIYYLNGEHHLMALPLMLTACVGGFLFWNFPPARIFMGDAGSGFLGFILGVLSIQAAHAYETNFWCWLILLGVFIVDATYTLIRRAIRGIKVYEAHRSHAYQKAATLFGRHLPVTLIICMINLCWLTPIAILVSFSYLDGFMGFLIAYAPLAILAIKLEAGMAD